MLQKADSEKCQGIYYRVAIGNPAQSEDFFSQKKLAPDKTFTGEGIDEFLDELGKILRENRIHINRCFKYQDAGRIQLIREFGTLISEEYTQDGIEVEAYVPKEIYDKL